MRKQALIMILVTSLCCNTKVFTQDITNRETHSCLNILRAYSTYWIKDSLADNGFRELLGYRVLRGCQYKGHLWKDLSRLLGKADFIYQRGDEKEYRYRLNRYVDDIKHPGTLLLDILVDEKGIVTSFVIWEVDG